MFTPDSSFPYPQANSIAKIMSVVDIVSSGIETVDGIAHALDMDERQGAYYANAAGWLRLVTRRTDPVTDRYAYALTDDGERFHNLDARARVDFIKDRLADIDDVVLASADEDISGDLKKYEGLDGDTLRRRVECIRSWGKFVVQPDFESDYSQDRRFVSSRLEAALSVDKSAREPKKAKHVGAVESFCPGCFMTLPATGLCDNCE